VTTNNFSIHFWGVRGSIPTPSISTVRYGGNTPCVEMRCNGKRLIFDGGTGLRVLGQCLLKEMPLEAHLFFTHSHWDHIQGFPFFTPAYIAGNSFKIYGRVMFRKVQRKCISTGHPLTQKLAGAIPHGRKQSK